MEQIRLLITGGTIDKTYNKLTGALEFKGSNFEKMISQGLITKEITPETIMLIDSLEMSDSDREKILETCKKKSENKIIIGHGTDTMIETAQLLGKSKLNKTIILFGSMVPFSFNNSDALFNFGSAVAAVQMMPVGVYLTMNGQIFDWNNVKKDKVHGIFTTIS